ncbi:MAG: response regulator transcription factor [Betaproteobacteria bacterium]|nr:response regulator transcription factor [Betaproteobacteria bacterium]
MPRILTIEDDEITAREIVSELDSHGYAVEWVASGEDGLCKALTGEFDAITLDRMLPDCDGLNIVTRLRQEGRDMPILMISALSDVDERVRGLRAGGDDYLTKPFSPSEMVARLEVLLRRNRSVLQQTLLKVGDLELNLLSRSARRAGQDLRLSPTQFRLLEFFMRNAGQVVTRSMLFEALWGYSFDPGTNVIDVHVNHLRKKVEQPGTSPLFQTIRGTGYVFGQTE